MLEERRVFNTYIVNAFCYVPGRVGGNIGRGNLGEKYKKREEKKERTMTEKEKIQIIKGKLQLIK